MLYQPFTPTESPLRSLTQVRITLLGPPNVEIAGVATPPRRRQLRALLYRLAVDLAPVPRDELCFLFWPDEADAAARRKLAVLLNLLRRSLEPHDPIIAQAGTVQLDPAAVWVDTVAFSTGVQEATASGQLTPLAAALALVQGALLQGFDLPGSPEFEQWLAEARQHWEQSYRAALTRLIDGATALGDYAQAIAAAERYLALDGLAEDIHRRLIWLYGASGNRPAALRQFERCAGILERELGVGVLAETLAVYESIRAQEAMDTTVRAGAAGGRPSWTIDLAAGSPRLAAKPLYGREGECALLENLLRAPVPRLITLSGPGGSGKTHLAQHVAASVTFPDGVVWVALGALRMPGLLLDVIAHACGVRVAAGSASSATLADQLHAALRPRHMLLVLDNAEHLLAAAGVIGDLLAAPHLRVLVTSRAALNLPGEQVVPVPPLPVPPLAALPPPAILVQQPAVALLVHRVQERQPAFALTEETAADLAAICVRLDGLPLVLELAAARLTSLPPRALLARLNHRLALLTRGPRYLPERQQTLRATIDWSYHLLDLDAQALFAHLAVFAGGCSLAAAVAVLSSRQPHGAPPLDEVAVLDLLEALIDHNLVLSTPGDEPRFTMLETLREYAQEQLDASGWAGKVSAAHAAFYRDLAAAATPHLRGPDGARWLEQLAQEHDNLRLAFAWFLDQASESDELLDFADTLHQFWWWRGEYHEARHWLERALARSRDNRSGKRINLLLAAGKVAGMLGDQATAVAWFESGLELCRAVDPPSIHALLLLELGRIYGDRGEFARAAQVLEDALVIRRTLGDPYLLILPLRGLAGMLCGGKINIERGLLLFEEGLALARDLATTGRFPAANMTVFLNDYSFYLALLGQHQQAATLLDECLALIEQIDFTPMRAIAMQTRGQLALLRGDIAAADQAFRASQEYSREQSTPRLLLGNLDGLAEVVAEAQPILATQLFAAADVARRHIAMLIEPLQQSFHDRVVDRLRLVLGPEQFAAAWQIGQTWSLEQALGRAIAGEPSGQGE